LVYLRVTLVEERLNDVVEGGFVSVGRAVEIESPGCEASMNEARGAKREEREERSERSEATS